MKNKRRDFLKLTGAASIGMATNMFNGFAGITDHQPKLKFMDAGKVTDDKDVSIIGQYGPWAASLMENKLPSLSFRRNEFNNVESWRTKARQCVVDRLGIPDIGGLPKVDVNKKYDYDGLHIEELSWQLPYGRATKAILLKPLNAKGKLPGILAFHDHGGNKYFGTRKITKTADQQHPLMITHQHEYYEGMAWANEIAKRGYVVLVSDSFTFASRRVMMQDLPEHMRNGLTDENPEDPKDIDAYNDWAAQHEHVMAKSLFCAGTTW
ncbi:MAG: hypothetical protein ACRDE8_16065, partial [Ginsengibacter sp.]